MRFGSLFAGIGGIDLGLECAGMKCAWQVEINPYCQRVLEKHWPEVKRYEDIKECGAANLDPVDLICGGFPCQDISYAGKGAGITGKRSGLWKEFYRVICELRPRFVLVENVPALLRRGLDVVLGDLASIGYDAEWESLPAVAFGALHRRKRIFVVAYTNQERRNGRPWVFGERRRQELTDGSQWLPEPDVGRVAHGIPSRVDRLRCLGNAVVPQVAEWIGGRILDNGHS